MTTAPSVPQKSTYTRQPTEVARPNRQYLEGMPPAEAPLDAWLEQFNREGFLFIKSVLTPETVASLKSALDSALAKTPDSKSKVVQLHTKMFEVSPAHVKLFETEPIVSFAEKAIAPDCHVIHNNSFISPQGGGITGWHQDDAPHFLVTSGEPPKNVILPCLLFTANYYLTDVNSVDDGAGQFIPGSHLFGKSPHNHAFVSKEDTMKGTEYEDKVVSCLGPAGSVLIFNNQVWHRGAPVTSAKSRYMAQVSYARRIIGHKYFPFMNYQMPEHVYKDANPRLKRLLGFLPSGAYG